MSETKQHYYVVMSTNPTGWTTWHGDDSCKLKLSKFNTDKIKYLELANNNLHIWELGEVMKNLGEENGEHNEWWFKLLAPIEIANLYMKKDETTKQVVRLPYGATNKDADVVAALNGPMAHVYVTNIGKLGKVAELLRLTLAGYYPSEALKWWDMDELD